MIAAIDQHFGVTYDFDGFGAVVHRELSNDCCGIVRVDHTWHQVCIHTWDFIAVAV